MIVSAVSNKLYEVAGRLDSIVNALTGAGDLSLDKGAAWGVTPTPRLHMAALRELYRNNHYARRVVNVLADDAVVNGWDILDPQDPRGISDPRWSEIMEKHDIQRVLSKALKFARAYGTGYIVPITYDLSPLDKPLDLNTLYEVRDFLVFDPDECQPDKAYMEETAGTRITDVASYTINAGTINSSLFAGKWGRALQGTVKIHASRVIAITGETLSTFEKLRHPFALGDSVLQAAFLPIARMDGIDGAAAILAQEMKQDVIRVPDLKAIGTSDASAAFKLRLSLLKLSKGLLGMIVLGADEEYESRASNVTGFKDLSQGARDSLVAAAEVPESILFGKSASGLASAPGAEQAAYDRKVQNIQTSDVKPALTRICTLFAASRLGPFSGQLKYRRFKIAFRPLQKEAEKDVLARSLIGAQRDAIHVGMLNAADPDLGKEFVRYLIANRYGESGWQDNLPPFRPGMYADPAPPPEAPAPPAPAQGAPGGPPKPASPDGQNPSTNLPGQADIGAQGVDMQANNTGLPPI